MKRITLLLVVVLVATLTGCMHFVAPPAPQPRPIVPVAASFSKTWDAVIDAFADRTVSIRTIDRTSGLIAADPVTVPYTLEDLESPNALANCGKGRVTGMAPRFVPPTNASYNVRVRGDSVASTILVTVRWTTTASRTFDPGTLCSSTGQWEGQFERLVKTKAESHH